MAFRTKGSSPITVDDVAYRWRIRRKTTYTQAVGEYPLTVSIQTERDPKCVLMVYTDRPRADNWLDRASIAITPAMVAEFIRDALAQGWLPTQPGSAFRLQVKFDSVT